MMIRAANLLAESRRVDTIAGASTTTPDWAPVARRIREQATDNWDDTVAVGRTTFLNELGIGSLRLDPTARFLEVDEGQ